MFQLQKVIDKGPEKLVDDLIFKLVREQLRVLCGAGG